jgi:hypothetical protein
MNPNYRQAPVRANARTITLRWFSVGVAKVDLSEAIETLWKVQR